MSRILQKRRELRDEYIRLARKYIDTLRDRIGPLTAFVYGSVARGDFNLGSDVDVLVVSPSLPEGFLERLELLYEDLIPPVEPKGYTPEEFRRMLAKRHPVVVEALEEGIILEDDLKISSGRCCNAEQD